MTFITNSRLLKWIYFNVYYVLYLKIFYSGRREMGDIMNYLNVNDTDRQAIYVDEDEPSITVDLTPWNSILKW